MKTLHIIFFSFLFAIAFNGCKKQNIASTYTYNVRMTDAPGPYNAVYIDLQGAEVIGSDGKAEKLNVQSGIYNLLTLSNGKDTLIAAGELQTATVEYIKLILGSNNMLVVGGVSYPLNSPSSEQAGLKIRANQTMVEGIANIVLLDFDANKSIVQEGNGSYTLKPVIRAIDLVASGVVKGTISPAGVLATVTAISTEGLSYSSNVNSSGAYMLNGLPAGMYTVTITPASPFKAVTQSNVEVKVGYTTNIYFTL